MPAEHLQRSAATGHLLKHPTTGHLAKKCGTAPCSDCGGEQDPVASIETTGTGWCDGDVSDLPFDAFADNTPDADHCRWTWTATGDTVPSLALTYSKTAGTWAGQYDASSFGVYTGSGLAVTCDPDTGKLSGSFTLDGIDGGVADCTGETASVTL